MNQTPTPDSRYGAPSYPLETAICLQCHSQNWKHFIEAEDDLTGKPGLFSFVTCVDCGLVYQNPRIPVSHIVDFYDDEYIAHRKQKYPKVMQPFFDRAMSKHDREKDKIVRKYVKLSGESSVLDVGCAVGTFLLHLNKRYGAKVSGVDFKDMAHAPGFNNISFYRGLFPEQNFRGETFDLITMWHFLEHDYDPLASLDKAKGLLKKTGKLVIEVPRLDSMSFKLFGDRWPGLQAPQHTMLLDKQRLLAMVQSRGLKVVDYLPYGAFPAYFYYFLGAASKIRKAKGMQPSKDIVPYFLGQMTTLPVFAFERSLNMAMQTVVCEL